MVLNSIKWTYFEYNLAEIASQLTEDDQLPFAWVCLF